MESARSDHSGRWNMASSRRRFQAATEEGAGVAPSSRSTERKGRFASESASESKYPVPFSVSQKPLSCSPDSGQQTTGQQTATDNHQSQSPQSVPRTEQPKGFGF